MVIIEVLSLRVLKGSSIRLREHTVCIVRAVRTVVRTVFIKLYSLFSSWQFVLFLCRFLLIRIYYVCKTGYPAFIGLSHDTGIVVAYVYRLEQIHAYFLVLTAYLSSV